MRRKEEWARPEWTHKVNKAVEKASVERDSSQTLIGSAEAELEQVMESLRALVPSQPRAAA
jgi:hypothetical protein